MFSILIALSKTFSTVFYAIIGVFRRVGGAGGSPPKDKGVLKKWLGRLANALKGLAGKTVEALPAGVGKVVVAILSFLGKVVGFVAEHT